MKMIEVFQDNSQNPKKPFHSELLEATTTANSIELTTVLVAIIKSFKDTNNAYKIIALNYSKHQTTFWMCGTLPWNPLK